MLAKKLAAIKVKRLYFQIAEKLMEQIRTGTYKAGERLPAERELAELFDVSRPTIREAIIALEVQGVVEVKTGSGVYVVRNPEIAEPNNLIRSFKPFDILEARLSLEPEIAALAASRISAQELFEMQVVLQRMERQFETRPENAISTDRLFHEKIIAAARNDALADLVYRLWQQQRRYDSNSIYLEVLDKYSAKPIIDGHNAIYAGLQAHDPVATREAVAKHCIWTIELYMEFTAADDLEVRLSEPGH